MATNDITSKEYTQFLELKEQMTKAMQQAESEFLFQTYNRILAVLNKRHGAATKLNISLEKAAIRELAKEKRASFQTKKAE
jgi:hypothetical protein